MNARRAALPPALAGALAQARARWRALAPRERRVVAAAGTVAAVVLIWLFAVQPAWRTLGEAPARLDLLDAQLQQMQRLAAESKDLRGAVPLSAAQSAQALKAASDRLGDRARLSLQGERAVLTLNGVSGEQFNAWLTEARSGARARPVEAQLARGLQGYTGTVTVSLGGAAP